MADYRENLIELVRARPLLWNPCVPDYKDKPQKTHVWDDGRLEKGSNCTQTE
ncbi:hypothetical protein BaRGS_00011180, partial [Batillaria attramentaria]